MAERSLRNCRILVVEDEYLLADELSRELEDAGADVIGPAPTILHAFALLQAEPEPDGAILDVNLGGDAVYPLADMLRDRGVPIIFTTGYDAAALPERFSVVPRCEKPISFARVLVTLAAAMPPA